MLATSRRENHQTTLEKAEQYGKIPQQGNHTGWVSPVKVRNAAPMTKKDEEKIQGLVCTYFEQQLRHDFLQNRVEELGKDRQKIAEDRQKLARERDEALKIAAEARKSRTEVNRKAVNGILTRIFKVKDEYIKELFSQEKLDKLGFENRLITIEQEGMNDVIVAYLKNHSIQALDLRNFDLRNGALERLFSSLPETDVSSICLSRQLSSEELNSKELAEKTLSDLGRTLRIFIK